MAYWLFKTEPSGWSWDDQVKAGPKGSEWTGVRNPVARNKRKQRPIGAGEQEEGDGADQRCA